MLVEPTTGTSLKGAQRMMMNFMIEPDELFDSVSQPYLLPYTYVRREFELDESQVNIILGDLKTANKVKLIIQLIGYMVGILLILGAAVLIWMMRRDKQEGRLNSYVLNEEEGQSVDMGVAMKKEPRLDETKGGEDTMDQTRQLLAEDSMY